MIVDIEEIENRLNSETNVIHKLRGEGRGGPSIPPFLNEVEAGLVIQGEKQKDVAEAFNTSPSSVNQSFNGTGNLTEQSKARIEARRSRAQEAAMDKLMDSLGLITEEKMDKCNALQLSAVATNMARVVEKMSGRNQSGINTLIVYAPQQKSEGDFKTISI